MADDDKANQDCYLILQTVLDYTCGNCGDYFTIWETLQAIFIEDEDGLVYLNIVNIT